MWLGFCNFCDKFNTLAKGDDKCPCVKANKPKLACNSDIDFCHQAETWSVRHFCVGFLISEVILSVDEGIKDVSSVDQQSPHFHS